MSFCASRSKTTAQMTRWQSSKVGSVKAKPIECLESSPETSLGSFRDWKHCHPAIDSEDIRRGRRDPGTCFDKILPDSDRRDQESVFFGSPLPGRYHQGRMQIRLSARPSGTLESVGSSRGSDSELSPCADDTDGGLLKKNWLAVYIRNLIHFS
jgi:hypothetical protein